MELKKALSEIFKKAKEKFDIQNTPKLILKQDKENEFSNLNVTD